MDPKKAIQVKSYLFPAHCEINASAIKRCNEIRRFMLAEPSYASLCAKLSATYGSDNLGALGTINTYWMDDEGDLVGFSSDEDFEMAIQQSQMPLENKVIKVYVSVPIAKRQQQSPFDHLFSKQQRRAQKDAKGNTTDPSFVHYGVVCDNCDGSVIGTRFKCTDCKDYDLCSECKDKNTIHTEHKFEEINSETASKARAPGVRGGHPWPFFIPGMGGPWRRSGPHGPRRNQQKPQSSQQQQPHQENQQQRPHYPYPDAHVLFGENFLHTLQSQMNQATSPEQLKNAGEFVKNVLGPMGIDVDYYVDSFNKMASGEPTKETKETEKPKETSASTSDTSNKKADQKEEIEMKEDETQKETDPVDSTTPLITIENSMPVGFEKAAEQLKSMIEAHQGPRQPGIQSQTAEKEKKDKEEVPASAPALTTTEKASVSASTSEKSLREMAADEEFNMVDISEEMKIIDTLEKLAQMGYSDEGGWLTRLVSAKHGHLNAVLDAIAPKSN